MEELAGRYHEAIADDLPGRCCYRLSGRGSERWLPGANQASFQGYPEDMNRNELIDKMADVKHRMNDLAGAMRSFAKAIDDNQDYLTAHADELAGATRMIDDWLNHLRSGTD